MRATLSGSVPHLTQWLYLQPLYRRDFVGNIPLTFFYFVQFPWNYLYNDYKPEVHQYVDPLFIHSPAFPFGPLLHLKETGPVNVCILTPGGGPLLRS